MTHYTSEEKMNRASIRLTRSSPFYAALTMRMSIEVSGNDIATMATDGRTIFYSPDFVDRLSLDEIMGVLAHEGLHMGLGHHVRRGDRDPTLFNIAADVVINHMLISDGMTLPPDGLTASVVGEKFNIKSSIVNEMHEYSTEKIYNLLTNTKLGNDICEGNKKMAEMWGSVMDGKNPDGSALTPDQIAEAQADAADALAASAHSAKLQGKLPAFAEKMIRANAVSQVDWRNELRQFVSGDRPYDYSYRKQNRRYADSGFVMPTIERNGVGPIVAFIDTSGSIGERELSAFLGELNGILQMVMPETLTVVPIDARVHEKGIKEYTPGDEIVDWKAHGGGGTDFRPAWAWLKDKPDTYRVIYLTDGYGDFPDGSEIPTFWLMTTTIKAPFGTTIPIIV